MKDYLVHNEWKIIEEDFHPACNRVSESIFSIGNGYTGQRANFEEKYSGDSLQGNYVAGVYYPDKTLVGWWKNGYPEYFAKILNAANWIGIGIGIDGEELDLARSQILHFRRQLDMQTALLTRAFTALLPSGKKVEVVAERFLSMKDKELGMIRYRLKSLNFSAPVRITSWIDGDVQNEDSNYDEKFWVEVDRKVSRQEGFLTMETRKTGFQLCYGMTSRIYLNGVEQSCAGDALGKEKQVANSFDIFLNKGEEVTIEKQVTIHSSLYTDKADLMKKAARSLQKARAAGFDRMFEEHCKAWAKKWET
ncbi:MAG: glycoside hydrolase family 65 protein, partial [Mangrovibacterium sp.]